MTYRLFIMDRAYSSWSLRGHLLLDAFGIPFQTTHAHWPSAEFENILAEIAPARTVPALQIDGTDLVWDSLAIAEEIASRHPEAGIWPKEPAARAAARSLAAEMHSGFPALRAECPMNLRRRYSGFSPSAPVLAEASRASQLWAWARERFGGGPFLFGEFSAVDAMFLPLASRFETYGLPRTEADDAYFHALHTVPAFRRWRAMALATPRVNPNYEFDLPPVIGPLPGAIPLPAKAVERREPANHACPYSGRPVAADSIAEIDGHVIGYCNTFCRDKSVADAEAWPQTVALLATLNRKPT